MLEKKNTLLDGNLYPLDPIVLDVDELWDIVRGAYEDYYYEDKPFMQSGLRKELDALIEKARRR